MKLTKITGKMMGFYILWKAHQDNKDEFIPTWRFVGEVDIPELKTCVMMSYKVPARLSDIYTDNPDLLERKLITGKSGAEYFGYKFAYNVNKDLILDSRLRLFYDALKTGKRHMDLLEANNLE